jgi:hypothetical protein
MIFYRLFLLIELIGGYDTHLSKAAAALAKAFVYRKLISMES